MEICRGAIRRMVKRRVTLVLVGEAHYFDIAKLKLPNQTFEHHQPVRPLDGIVVEMSVSRKNYVDPEGWKLIQEPLWVKACWIIAPRIGENRQTGR